MEKRLFLLIKKEISHYMSKIACRFFMLTFLKYFLLGHLILYTVGTTEGTNLM